MRNLRVSCVLSLILLSSACSVKAGLGGMSSSSGSSGPGVASSSGGGESSGGPARRDGKFVVHPGAPLKTMRAEPCTADNNHCLRPEAWFVADPYVPDALEAGRFNAIRAVFEFEGGWWTWLTQNEQKPGPAFRTVPATAANVKVGEPVIWYSDRYSPVPPTEYDAHFSAYWTMGLVKSISGNLLDVGGQEVDLGSARVIVERK